MNLELSKAQLRIALQNNSAKRTKLSNKGTVVPSRLAHYQTSDLIYCEPIPNTGKDYIVDILIDVSGSMFPDSNNPKWRMFWAINSAKELVRLLYWIVDFRIILFWKWFKSISTNELLSYKDEDLLSHEWCIKLFHSNYWVKIIWKSAINWEWYWFSGDTNYTMAIANSLSSFESKSWWKYIFLITDWYENYSFRDYEKVNWIRVMDFSSVKSLLENSDTKLLPIWIDIDLSSRFNNPINITQPSSIIEETIKYLQNNL